MHLADHLAIFSFLSAIDSLFMPLVIKSFYITKIKITLGFTHSCKLHNSDTLFKNFNMPASFPLPDTVIGNLIRITTISSSSASTQPNLDCCITINGDRYLLLLVLNAHPDNRHALYEVYRSPPPFI